jgi:hypothetical protein
MRYVVNVVRLGEGRDAYMVLARTPEVKRPLGRPKRKWENNIKIDGGMDWIDLAQDRQKWQALVNAVMNLPIRGE